MLRISNGITKCHVRYYKIWNSICEQITLSEMYKRRKRSAPKTLINEKDSSSVFVCNRINLEDVTVYGFSYNEVLVKYTTHFDELLFDTAKHILVEQYKYPKEVNKLKYDPSFPILGLHFDTRFGTILKLNSFVQVQPLCVFRGKTLLPNKKVEELYSRMLIPSSIIDIGQSSKSKVVKYLSSYHSLPAIDLICSVIDVFDKNKIKFIPEILYHDIVKSLYIGMPIYKKAIADNPEKYIIHNPGIRKLVEKLKDNGKKLFILSNNEYNVVNKGLDYTIGKDWKDFFDLIIMDSRKPEFFRNPNLPFREYRIKTQSYSWTRATKLKKKHIYLGGNVYDMMSMEGWKPHKVLYFGNNPYKELTDIQTKLGWNACAVVHELDHELKIINSDTYKKVDQRDRFLSLFIEECQDRVSTEEDAKFLKECYKKRKECMMLEKSMFNNHFGSVFRTYNNPTLYGRKLFRSCDIYTSKVSNLLSYNLKQKFTPLSTNLPHEYVIF